MSRLRGASQINPIKIVLILSSLYFECVSTLGCLYFRFYLPSLLAIIFQYVPTHVPLKFKAWSWRWIIKSRASCLRQVSKPSFQGNYIRADVWGTHVYFLHLRNLLRFLTLRYLLSTSSSVRKPRASADPQTAQMRRSSMSWLRMHFYWCFSSAPKHDPNEIKVMCDTLLPF